ncbi:MAG: peptide chain release factor N(5)-glutamine methyltransferase [Planctomycetes bacterium]|nr:peptide chain release factor N(5)-glutamine methyltransferase [Planctomycetota bacterium]
MSDSQPGTAATAEVARRENGEAWTTRRLLAWMTERFTQRDLDAPRIVAEMLLAHVLGCERLRLYMEADRPASREELSTLRALVVRADAHEPVQYLVGRASFFTRDLIVDDSTLIPQPCTEDLVEAVLAWHRGREIDGPVRIADIGTGSGCIAISLAAQLPDATILATDVVPAALELAERNAKAAGVEGRIELVAGPGLEPLLAAGGVFDVICSNPPYISDAEWDGGQVQRAVRDFVPASALRGGPDGLDIIRPILAGAGAVLAPGGLLAMEIGHAQRDAVLALAGAAGGLGEARVEKDHEGYWRVLLAQQG